MGNLLSRRKRRRKPRQYLRTEGESPGAARLRALSASPDDIFFSLRFPEGRYEYISPSVRDIFGFPPSDFYASADTVLRCIAPRWRDQVRDWITGMAKGDVPGEYEFQIIDRGGRLRWMRQRQVLLPLRRGWRVAGVAQELPVDHSGEEVPAVAECRRALDEGWSEQIVLRLNLQTRFMEYVSPGIERITGHPPADFYARPLHFLDVISPQWRGIVAQWVEELAQGFIRPEYEYPVLHTSGQPRWINQRGAIIRDADGRPAVAQFVVFDVTERRSLEDALAESEARYRELAESWTHQALIRFNLRTDRFEYVSPGMTKLFGFLPEEFYSEARALWSHVPEEYRARLRNWKEENQRGLLWPEYEYEIIDARGERRWVLQRGSLIHDASGQPVVVQAVLSDNTDRRRLQDALRESNRRHRLLSENLVDVIWALDENLRWTYLSPSAEALFRSTVEKLMARALPELLTRESMDSVTQALNHWRQQNTLRHDSDPLWLSLELYDAKGVIVPVEVLARPTVDAQGAINGYCGTARDIRLRRRMERVEAQLSRLAKSLLECEDLAQSQVLAAACAEEVTGAHLAVAAHRNPETSLLQGPDGAPPPDEPDALSLAVLHAGKEVGRIVAYGVPRERASEARQLLERVASLFALAVVRQRAEEALRKSERMARMLLESMHEGVWALDRDQRAIFANERLAAMLGYTVPELLALSPADVLDPLQRQKALERMQEHRLGLAASADYELRRKDGALLPVHMNASPILDESGGFEGLVCTAADLSERRLMERELRGNQARFEALYELSRLTASTEAQTAAFTLREALRLTESSGGVLFFVDPAGERLTPMASSAGQAAGAGRGAPPSFACGDDSPWGRLYAFASPLILNDAASFTAQLPPGHPPVKRFLGVPALDGDRPAAILGLTGKARDYTDDDGLHVALLMDGMWRIVRGRRDEARIRASLREKEALLREVHHRVKNNLQVVCSLLDMAGRRLPDPDARRSMEEVRAKVLAMSLVHAQLHGGNAAQSDAGRGVDLERYVRALFRQLREIYSGNMSLTVSVLLGGLTLGLDQAAPLGLALNEILANAFKHGRRDGQEGRVRLRAWREEDGAVRIQVRDDGPGLPEGLAPERAASLGLKLMFGLVRNQLGGTLALVSAATGVCADIRFRPNIAE